VGQWWGYTGQRWEAGIGLYDYNARYYDPALGRFVQADTVVPSPQNSQSLNRYLYTLGNPLKYIDPSGNTPKTSDGTPPIKRSRVASFFNGKVVLDSVTFAEGTNGTRQTQSKAVALVADAAGVGLVVTTILNLAEIIITIPLVDEVVSVGDLGLTTLGSWAQGETYCRGQPHPDLPEMTVIGQDTLLAGADLLTGIVSDIAALIAAGPTEGVSVVIGETIMELPSAVSIVHNVGRLLGKIPTEGALGFYTDDQGVLHIVALDYTPAEDDDKTTRLGR
jgi:RHS repeat-associated protein